MAAGGDDTSTKWSLDLDAESALETVAHLKEGLDKVSEVEGINGLISTLGEMGLVVGTVGAAIFAMKETFDLVFDAEKIQQVEHQFEVLSERAGVAGDALKRALVEASGGMVDENALLQSANKGIIELGANAGKFGDIMKIARGVTQVMGGDIKSNFDAMVSAVASGNARGLRHLGIIIDQQKAYGDYAQSIGVSASELSRAGQQQALLNALLERGGAAVKDLGPPVDGAIESWQQFKTTLKDVGDMATLAFNKIAGPVVKAEIGGLSAIAKDAKRWFTDMFGAGAEQAAAHTERLKDKIQDIKGQLIDLEQKKLGHVFDPNPGDTNSRFQALTAQLKKYESELGITQNVERKVAAEAVTNEKAHTAAVKENVVNLELRAKNQLKYAQQLAALQEKTLADQKRLATSEQQMDRINAQMKLQILQQSQIQQQQIDRQEGLSTKQKEDLKIELARQAQMKLKLIQKQEDQDRLQALKNFEEENKNTAAGFVAGWQRAGREASMEFMDFAKLGEKSVNAVSGAVASAFKAMGDGSESAGEAMKKALLSALGEIAISEGSMLTVAGIGEFNPVKIGAGIALTALGGFLLGKAGGGGGAAPPTESGAGGGSAGGQGYGGSQPASGPSNLQQAPQKSVSLTIHGNYYDSNETKMQLMDMIRQSTDATDFNYFKVGGK